MDVNFGYTFDDKRTLTKAITWIEPVVNCRPYSEFNITHPVLILSENAPAILNNNYAYISEYSRYYFIDSIDIDRNGRYIAHLSIDVLQTYNSGIKNIRATISRQENIGINDIVDDKLPLLNRKQQAVIEFSSSEFNIDTASNNTYNFVLNVAGGGSESNAVNGGTSE